MGEAAGRNASFGRKKCLIGAQSLDDRKADREEGENRPRTWGVKIAGNDKQWRDDGNGPYGLRASMLGRQVPARGRPRGKRNWGSGCRGYGPGGRTTACCEDWRVIKGALRMKTSAGRGLIPSYTQKKEWGRKKTGGGKGGRSVAEHKTREVGLSDRNGGGLVQFGELAGVSGPTRGGLKLINQQRRSITPRKKNIENHSRICNPPIHRRFRADAEAPTKWKQVTKS